MRFLYVIELMNKTYVQILKFYTLDFLIKSKHIIPLKLVLREKDNTIYVVLV